MPKKIFKFTRSASKLVAGRAVLDGSKPTALLQGGLIALTAAFITGGIIYAGSLTPSASPAATSYTLEDIYIRLTANTTATAANHDLSTTTSPAASFYTLTQIYEAIPTIDASKLLDDTTYLGVTGTMADNGAFSLTASSSDQTVTAGYYSGGTLAGDTDLTAANINSGTEIFGVTGTLSGAELHTGQTVSYATSSPDDADDDGTAKSYTDNGDLTVTDDHTGLMWQKLDADSMNWEDALVYCSATSTAGHTDWRLPSIVEGITMLDYACTGAGGSCYADFQNSALDWTNTGGSGNLWLSTTRTDYTSYAYSLVASTGYVSNSAKSNTFDVRCVR